MKLLLDEINQVLKVQVVAVAFDQFIGKCLLQKVGDLVREYEP